MNFKLFYRFGAHEKIENFVKGIRFTLFAPNAKQISVVGNFNNWNHQKNFLEKISDDGVWSIFIPNLAIGEEYKYCITTKENIHFLKSDPFAFFSEFKPQNISKIYNPFSHFSWRDSNWIKNRENRTPFSEPISIYEIHLGSWKQKKNIEDNEDSFFNYREIANLLIPYIKDMGFTHIQILPLVEHSLDSSWGYQGMGYFSITSRYGTPDDFKYFVNLCHENNIGVILDWSPSHFSKEEFGLYRFDGSALFEYNSDILGENSNFGTANFDFRKEFVKDFILSSAYFLFEVFHIDGLKIDNLSNLLYLEYGKESSGLKNALGRNTKLEAIDFLKELNSTISHHFPNVLLIADESTSWSSVTKPIQNGGLGFNFKWNTSWIHDMLRYMSLSASDREKYHNLLTFSLIYAFSEQFILPLSHDEVVYGKKSLLNKMSGDYKEKFDSLRMFFAFMFAYPGKKLFFMGSEIAPFSEWNSDVELEWNLLKYPQHNSLRVCIKNLNSIYKTESALYRCDFSTNGFEWINHKNHSQKIISFLRKTENESILIICNFTDKEFKNHHIGVPKMTDFIEIFNSDDKIYGGSNHINEKVIKTVNKELDDHPFSISLNIAPMSTIYLKSKCEIEKNGNH